MGKWTNFKKGDERKLRQLQRTAKEVDNLLVDSHKRISCRDIFITKENKVYVERIEIYATYTEYTLRSYSTVNYTVLPYYRVKIKKERKKKYPLCTTGVRQPIFLPIFPPIFKKNVHHFIQNKDYRYVQSTVKCLRSGCITSYEGYGYHVSVHGTVFS